MRDARGAILWPAAIGCLAAPPLALAGAATAVRLPAALLLFCLAPGAAAMIRLPRRALPAELGLTVAISLGTIAVVAQLMLWLGAWSPMAATWVVAAACVPAIAGQLRPGRPP